MMNIQKTGNSYKEDQHLGDFIWFDKGSVRAAECRPKGDVYIKDIKTVASKENARSGSRFDTNRGWVNKTSFHRDPECNYPSVQGRWGQVTWNESNINWPVNEWRPASDAKGRDMWRKHAEICIGSKNALTAARRATKRRSVLSTSIVGFEGKKMKKEARGWLTPWW